MPESAGAQKMLTNTMRIEISQLLYEIVAELKCEAEATQFSSQVLLGTA